MTQLTWQFQLPRTHTGILLGNGIQGVMIWGSDSLNITIGRAGFWDHRGGNAFTSRTTFAAVRALLETGDAAGLYRAFEQPARPANQPAYPTQIGCGRLELRFADGWHPVRGELNTADYGVHTNLIGLVTLAHVRCLIEPGESRHVIELH